MLQVESPGDVRIADITFNSSVATAVHIAVGPPVRGGAPTSNVTLSGLNLNAVPGTGGVVVVDTLSVRLAHATCTLARCLTFQYNLDKR